MNHRFTHAREEMIGRRIVLALLRSRVIGPFTEQMFVFIMIYISVFDLLQKGWRCLLSLSLSLSLFYTLVSPSSALTHTHTHVRSLSRSHTLTQSFSRSLFHSLSRSHTLTHVLSLSFSHSLRHKRALTHTLTHSLSHTHSLIHSHTHTLSLSHTDTHTHTHSLSLSLSHSHTHTLSLTRQPLAPSAWVLWTRWCHPSLSSFSLILLILRSRPPVQTFLLICVTHTNAYKFPEAPAPRQPHTLWCIIHLLLLLLLLLFLWRGTGYTTSWEVNPYSLWRLCFKWTINRYIFLYIYIYIYPYICIYTYIFIYI